VVGKRRRSSTGRERRKSAAAALLLLLGLGPCCPTERKRQGTMEEESEMERRRQGSPLQKIMTHGEEVARRRIFKKSQEVAWICLEAVRRPATSTVSRQAGCSRGTVAAKTTSFILFLFSSNYS
jgi:hypothetical protein